MCVGKIRPRRLRTIIAGQRFREPRQLRERVATIGMGFGQVCVLRQRAVIARHRLVEAFQLLQRMPRYTTFT